jgi:flagellar basal-body rod protein FlgC
VPQAGFDDLLSGDGDPGTSVRVSRVVKDQQPPRQSYDPGHPHANKDGYVSLPNVNVVTEMVDLMSASGGYEGNVGAVTATKRGVHAARHIGRA